MKRIRLTPDDGASSAAGCCRCQRSGNLWDQIAGKPYCPECQESIAMGEGEPLLARTVKIPCAVCDRLGTVCFLTVPLNSDSAVVFDLCPEHLRGLVGRHLGPFAYHQLRRLLQTQNIAVGEIFLLHEEFYDECGRALHPLSDMGQTG